MMARSSLGAIIKKNVPQPVRHFASLIQPTHKRNPRRPKPAYQLNNITADLDNPFLEGVRVVTPEDEDTWEHFWVHQPEKQEACEQRQHIDEVATFIQESLDKSRRAAKRPCNPWSVLESDLLEHAFREYSTGSELRRVMMYRGIPFGEDTKPSYSLHYLLHHHQSYCHSPRPGYSSPAEFVEVVSQLNESDFIEWRRLILASLRSQSLEGETAFSSESEEALIAAYVKMAGNEQRDKEALAVLHNVAINLGGIGCAIGKSFCLLGLMLGSRIVSFPSIQQFLQLCFRHNYLTNVDLVNETATGMSSSPVMTAPDALHRLLYNLAFLLRAPSEFPVRPRKSDTFTVDLLTTLTRPGLPLKVSLAKLGEKQHCLRAAIGESSVYLSAYVQYIHILGLLGARSLLWFEYHLRTGLPTPECLPGLRQQVFASAALSCKSAPRHQFLLRHFAKTERNLDYWSACDAELTAFREENSTFEYGQKRRETDPLKIYTMAMPGQDTWIQTNNDEKVAKVISALELPLVSSMKVLQEIW